jgi:hypothetical protein
MIGMGWKPFPIIFLDLIALCARDAHHGSALLTDGYRSLMLNYGYQ